MGITKHRIDVGDIQPIRQPILLPKKVEAAKITKSSGIRKKGRCTPFCVDYQKLNGVAKKDLLVPVQRDNIFHTRFEK